MQRRPAVVVVSYPGQAAPAEAHQLVAEGTLPRNAQLEVARAVGADIVDPQHVSAEGTWLARAVTRVAGVQAGQVAEVVLRRRRHPQVLVWADRMGLPIAFLNKVTRSKQDVVMVSVDLSAPQKAFFLRTLRAHTHLKAVAASSTVQVDLARNALGVPADKLHLVPPGVDTVFWRNQQVPTERRVCSVGWEARDYGTFVRAMAGLGAEADVALGSLVFASPSGAGVPAPVPAPGTPAAAGTGISLDAFAALKGTQGYRRLDESLAQLGTDVLPSNITWHQQLRPQQLRCVYARCRVVVIPLYDVGFDAGYTATLEAMAMGKPVVITRARGQVDLVEHGVNGLYVPVGDADALRGAVLRLLDAPEQARSMGAAGRALVEQRFGLDAYVHQLAGLVMSEAHGDDPAASAHRA